MVVSITRALGERDGGDDGEASMEIIPQVLVAECAVLMATPPRFIIGELRHIQEM